MAFFPRLVLMGLNLAQPYLVNASILYITFHASRPINYGYGLIGAFALTYFLTAVRISSHYVEYSLLTSLRSSPRDGICT